MGILRRFFVRLLTTVMMLAFGIMGAEYLGEKFAGRSYIGDAIRYLVAGGDRAEIAARRAKVASLDVELEEINVTIEKLAGSDGDPVENDAVVDRLVLARRLVEEQLIKEHEKLAGLLEKQEASEHVRHARNLSALVLSRQESEKGVQVLSCRHDEERKQFVQAKLGQLRKEDKKVSAALQGVGKAKTKIAKDLEEELRRDRASIRKQIADLETGIVD